MSSRRRFLMAAGTAAAVAGFGGWEAMRSPGRDTDGGTPLAIPPLLDARKDGRVLLSVREGRTRFFPDAESATLGYNGAYLGPTIRVHSGDKVPVEVTNRLAVSTTVHWHGLVVPGELDGGPHQVIVAGGTWSPVLPIRQPAATLIYHAHIHGATAEQVYRGLAGVLVVADEAEKALGLPSEYGVDDIPLVIQDRQFERGRLVVPSGMMVAMQGRRGDTLLVNGTPDAVASVPARLVRLRLVNASNARIYHLAFDDGRAFHWIASEGGLLEAPVELRTIALAPGQRAEVLVDFSSGASVALVTGSDTNRPMMGMMARVSGMAQDALALGRSSVVRFAVGRSEGRPAPVPERLARIEPLDPARAARRRRFVLDMGMDMGGGMGGGMMGGGMGGGTMGGMASINGRAFDPARIDERVRVGDTEIWEVSGQMMFHPFHMHGVQFTVLRRGGGEPRVEDRGLRDTVLVREPVELLVRFTQPSGSSPFMYHCHILEHEDGGMMAQYAAE